MKRKKKAAAASAAGGKKRSKYSKDYTEGWVEFRDKRVAKRVAVSLHNTPMGSRRRSPFRYDLWNLKVRGLACLPHHSPSRLRGHSPRTPIIFLAPIPSINSPSVICPTQIFSCFPVHSTCTVLPGPTSASDWLWVMAPHQGLCLPESEPERQGGIPTLERGRDLCLQPDRPRVTFLCLCWGLLYRIS